MTMNNEHEKKNKEHEQKKNKEHKKKNKEHEHKKKNKEHEHEHKEKNKEHEHKKKNKEHEHEHKKNREHEHEHKKKNKEHEHEHKEKNKEHEHEHKKKNKEHEHKKNREHEHEHKKKNKEHEHEHKEKNKEHEHEHKKKNKDHEHEHKEKNKEHEHEHKKKNKGHELVHEHKKNREHEHEHKKKNKEHEHEHRKNKEHKKKNMDKNALEIQRLQISSSMEKIRTCPKNHELMLKNNRNKCNVDEYECKGCRVGGFGNRFRCDKCDYDLHIACMHSTPTTRHKFLKDSTFEFYDQLPKNCNECKRDCEACGKQVKGFVYHCHEKDLVLHPCCRNLENELECNGKKFRLGKTKSKCVRCNQIKGWSYVSNCGKFNFHVDCMREILFELVRKKGKSTNTDDLSLKTSERKRNSGMSKNLLEMAEVILPAIVSIFIGDPTALIGILVNLVFSLIKKLFLL